ncbi:AbrB/MazE/SpoVT family DNA-binding domain-containing protein [Halomarina pelagica]|uniref:AbrB/MazE/SpoVT family DNA-binding domain-containing protein n=1 Tax=Halomarina pelagica TaxID=2961599 RepID=UPI0020C24209|nr:AbrB/MazE/SpoVT family DNA-binding domain-containing protein [Halomarina sp. BND7]
MTDEQDELPWSPAFFARQMQKAGEEFTEQQTRLFEQMLSTKATSPTNWYSDVMSVGTEMALFKTRVQSGGRLSIPDAEREALDIDEGDIVQVFVVPVKRTAGDRNER